MMKIFIRFLKEYKIYQQFFMEITNDEERTIMEKIGKEIPEYYILSAFFFDETKQGYDFWEQINYKWYQMLKIYNNETTIP